MELISLTSGFDQTVESIDQHFSFEVRTRASLEVQQLISGVRVKERPGHR